LNYRDKPELRERLAAEYALGTLRGAARARFARWMREDGALARAVLEWQERLAPMALAVAPRRPPARVWEEIESRLGAAKTIASRKDRFWRPLALIAGGAAAALLFMMVMLPLQNPAGSAAYVAVLSDAKTLRPVLYVSAGRKDTRLRVKALDPSIQVSDASLELWALPKGGKPKSLGLIAGERGVVQLASIADQALADVPMLAVTLEPKGGSKTGLPSGPVLYSGPCVRDW
jgi:anti-sigma-K factor RskA